MKMFIFYLSWAVAISVLIGLVVAGALRHNGVLT